MQIQFEGIDHIVVPVADLPAAAAGFERLGLRLTPPARHAGMGTENRVFFVGTAESLFYVELIGVADAAAAAADPRGSEIAAAVGRGGLLTVMLRVRNFAASLQALEASGLQARTRSVRRADGSLIGTVADLDVLDQAGFPVSFIEYDEPQAARFERYVSRGLLDHALPLQRLNGLAAVTDAPERTARFWSERLGIKGAAGAGASKPPVQRLAIGDAALYLLGRGMPDGSRSEQPHGPVPSVSFEVTDVVAAEALVRAAGFSPSRDVAGLDSSTLTSTITAQQTGSIGLSFVQSLM